MVKKTELNNLLIGIQSVGENFPPELQKVAKFVLENPYKVGFSSIRELAKMARVKHSTMVRFAKVNGFATYSEFREVFRPGMSSEEKVLLINDLQVTSYQAHDKIRVPSVGKGISRSDLDTLDTPVMHRLIRSAAKEVVGARTCFVLGVGVANSVAQNFTYLAGMIGPDFKSLPFGGDLPIDVLGRGTKEDILVAMTFKPFRKEVVEAVKFANSLGIPVIAISDSPACPIMAKAKIRFVIPTSSPHFFPSMVTVTALFELLLGYLISEIGNDVIEDLRDFHNRRHSFGIYVEEADELGH